MSRLRLLISAAMVALALAVCAAPAVAKAKAKAQSQSVIADCQAHSGTLSKTYSVKQLEAALKSINATTREYTSCANAIQNQLNQVLGGSTTPIGNEQGGSGGGSGTIILIVVIVVVLLIGGGGAFWAYRRNQNSTGPQG